MKILLQHLRSREFMSVTGEWTPHINLARDFQRSQHAIAFAREHRLADTRIYMKYDGGERDEVVPLPKAPRAAQTLACA